MDSVSSTKDLSDRSQALADPIRPASVEPSPSSKLEPPQGLDNLPNEVLFTIITNVPFTKTSFMPLLLTNRRFMELITIHKVLIMQGVMQSQFQIAYALEAREEIDTTLLCRLQSRTKQVDKVIRLCHQFEPPSDPLYSVPRIRQSTPELRFRLGLHLYCRVTEMVMHRSIALSKLYEGLDLLPDTCLLLMHEVVFVFSGFVERALYDRFVRRWDDYLVRRAVNYFVIQWGILAIPAVLEAEWAGRPGHNLVTGGLKHYLDNAENRDMAGLDDYLKGRLNGVVGEQADLVGMDSAVAEELQKHSDDDILEIFKGLELPQVLPQG